MIRLKELLKMYGTIALSFGAVVVSTIFLNYYIDLSAIDVPKDAQLQIIYDGQITMSKITTACAGGVLGAITLIMLLFSISHYINRNQANMGILKAIGYSEWRIVCQFLKYGLPIFFGTSLGYIAGILLAFPVYSSMSEYKSITPEVSFHIEIPLLLVIMPTALFALLSCIFAEINMKKNPLEMIKGAQNVKVTNRTIRMQKSINEEKFFLINLKTTMRTNHPVLFLLVAIASWGFSSMIQMAFTMISMGMSDMAPMICAPIGIMLGFVSLIIAIDFVLTINRPYISLMKAYGYTDMECYRTLLNGYRPAACIGFIIGTLYQYYFMKFMVSLFAGAYDVKVTFTVKGFLITLLSFVIYYECVMFYYKKKVEKVSLREAMIE